MKNLRLSLSLYLLVITLALSAQGEYFQQEVDYQIGVRLDDQSHQLLGRVNIRYQNNAPVALDTLYFHLWPNAYRNTQTAYANQLRRRGEGAFLFSDASSKGYIDSLDFKINDEVVEWSFDRDHIDIAFLLPQTPIQPGETIVITTPFKVQIPYCFSRLGHVDQSYQITQWFPKPAVYDASGWHPMPYLDMGEFYSEFGDFEVTITLPDNYLIAATGTLQTPSEQIFLEEQLTGSNDYLSKLQADDLPKLDFPESSKRLKKVSYQAKSVHDFAWFADKRFIVQKDTLQLSSGKTINCWAFFTQEEQELWQNATSYIKRSLKYYSERVGEYPYPQATAVQTALGAGGGMEYPMITNCGLVGDAQTLDELIAHEVGHNWFYGILASNERDHPWMDEGLNSYYDHAYSKQYYGGPDFSILPGFLFSGTEMSVFRLAYLFQARRYRDQAPDTHSDELTEINYFLGAYEKPAQILHYLSEYLGQEQYDAAMQSYYQQWQFKHPQPQDFQHSMEQFTQRELDWLFEGFLYSDVKQDYSIKSIERNSDSLYLTIKNKGLINGPFTLDGIHANDTLSEWINGFSGTKRLALPLEDYSKIVLDQGRTTLDINRQNNQIKTAGAFKKAALPRFRFFTAVEDDTRPNIYWLPIPSWNDYDKWMAGLLLYNTSVPSQRFEWRVAPSYSFSSRSLTGMGDMHFNFYPGSSNINKIALGAEAQSYHYRHYATEDEHLRYARWQPYLKFQFKEKISENLHRELMLRNIWIQEEQLQFTQDGTFDGTAFNTNSIQEVRFTSEKYGGINKSNWTLAVEHQAYDGLGESQSRYVKAALEWQREFHFEEEAAFNIRFFGGTFLYNTERSSGFIAPGAFNLISQGYNDYRYDDLYLGRTTNTGFLAQQISNRDGGFKNAIGQGFALGRSNDFVLALNLKSDLPSKILPWLPLKPYLDIGYFSNAMPTGSNDTFQDQLLWSGGLMLSVLDESVAVYFPLLNSNNLNDLYAERGNYWKRIAFQFNLKKLSPWRMVDRLNF